MLRKPSHEARSDAASALNKVAGWHMRSVGQFVTLQRGGPREHGESGLENPLQSEAV